MSEVKPKVILKKDYPLRRTIAAFGALPLFFFATLLLSIPVAAVAALNATGGELPEISIALGLGLTIAAEVATIIWALWYGGALREWRSVLSFVKPKGRHLWLGAAVGLVGFLGLQALALLLGAMGLSIESSETTTTLGSLTGWQYYLVFLIMVPLVVPLVEETFFRGLILGFFRTSRITAVWVSVLVSSIYFGVVHFQGFDSLTGYLVIIWTGLLGAAYAWLVLRTGSLWSAYVGHAVYNGITVLVSLAASGAN